MVKRSCRLLRRHQFNRRGLPVRCERDERRGRAGFLRDCLGRWLYPAEQRSWYLSLAGCLHLVGAVKPTLLISNRYPFKGPTHDAQQEGLYTDRASDRCRDHWYSCRDCDSEVRKYEGQGICRRDEV